DVMRSGTARRAFAGTSYQAAGKTGTAQVYSLKGAKYKASAVDERLRDHALFMAYAPVENPQLAVALIVENGGWGATVAAPIARKVFDYWLSPERADRSNRADAAAKTRLQANLPPLEEEGASGESQDAMVRPEDMPAPEEEEPGDGHESPLAAPGPGLSSRGAR